MVCSPVSEFLLQLPDDISDEIVMVFAMVPSGW